MQKAKLDISIIFEGNGKFILFCLDSIYKTYKGLMEIFVTSNLGSPQAIDEIKRRFPKVHLVINNKKKGFAQNHNNIIEKTDKKYILILNDDTVILDNAIEKLINYMEQHQEVGAIGPKLFNPDLSLQHSTFCFPSLFGTMIRLSGLRKYIAFNKITCKIAQFFYPEGKSRFWDHNKIKEVDSPGGPCILARRRAIEEVGLIDEITQFSGEDTEWLYRFKKRKWKVIFFPEAEIIHYGGESTYKKQSLLYEKEDIKGLLNFYRKHKNILNYFFLRAIIVLIFFIKYIISLLTLEKESANLYLDIIKISFHPQKSFKRKRVFY